MKKILSIMLFLAVITLTSSCQKELPDSIKNVDVNKGGGQTPTPTPDNPINQGDIPSEDDNPWPGY